MICLPYLFPQVDAFEICLGWQHLDSVVGTLILQGSFFNCWFLKRCSPFVWIASHEDEGGFFWSVAQVPSALEETRCELLVALHIPEAFWTADLKYTHPLSPTPLLRPWFPFSILAALKLEAAILHLVVNNNLNYPRRWGHHTALAQRKRGLLKSPWANDPPLLPQPPSVIETWTRSFHAPPGPWFLLTVMGFGSAYGRHMPSALGCLH